jgi:hypothetical protein
MQDLVEGGKLPGVVGPIGPLVTHLDIPQLVIVVLLLGRMPL